MQLVDQLRAFFHPKDRAVVIPDSVFALPLAGGSTLAWCLLRETVLAAPVVSVAFPDIPQNFRALAFLVQARTDRASTVDTVFCRANGDGGANYDYDNVWGNSGVAGSASGFGGASAAQLAYCDAANSRASCFGGCFALFPDYRKTAIEKQAWSIGGSVGTPTAATMYAAVHHIHWRGTAAITNLIFYPGTGPNFVANSVFQLYGIM